MSPAVVDDEKEWFQRLKLYLGSPDAAEVWEHLLTTPVPHELWHDHGITVERSARSQEYAVVRRMPTGDRGFGVTDMTLREWWSAQAGASANPELPLNASFPVGCDVQTGHGRGTVTKVTKDRIVVRLGDGGITTYHKDDALGGALTRIA